MAFLFASNNAVGQLVAAITSEATAFRLKPGQGAAFGTNFPFAVTIGNEILEVIEAGSEADEFNVGLRTEAEQNQGTTPAAHAEGATVELRPTKGIINRIVTALNLIEAGEWVTSTRIKAGAVTETKIGAKAVTAAKLANNAATEATIAVLAVTRAKLALALAGELTHSGVACATTGALAATYSAGVFTAEANGTLTIDGVSPGVGEHVLVKNQATATQNGLYNVANAGGGAAKYSLIRSSDMATGAIVPTGSGVYALGGTVNGKQMFFTNAGASAFNTIGENGVTWEVMPALAPGAGSITSAMLAVGAAVGNIAAGTITSAMLKAKAAAENLGAGEVTNTMLAGAIEGAKLKAKAAAENLGAAEVTSAMLAAGASLANLAANSITGAKLAVGAAFENLGAEINPSKIAPGYSLEREAVLYATAASLPANSYAAGVLTSTANEALVIDGSFPTGGQRVLVKNEAEAKNNGIYTVTSAGFTGTLKWKLTRATDMAIGASVISGVRVPVLKGSANESTLWMMVSGGPFVVDTNNLTWAVMTAASLNSLLQLVRAGIVLRVPNIEPLNGAYNARLGNVQTFTAKTTTGSAILTVIGSSTGLFASVSLGKGGIPGSFLTGTGIPAGTYVKEQTQSQRGKGELVMSANATAEATVTVEAASPSTIETDGIGFASGVLGEESRHSCSSGLFRLTNGKAYFHDTHEWQPGRSCKGTTNGTTEVTGITDFSNISVAGVVNPNSGISAVDITPGTHVVSVNEGAKTLILSAAATGSHAAETIEVSGASSVGKVDLVYVTEIATVVLGALAAEFKPADAELTLTTALAAAVTAGTYAQIGLEEIQLEAAAEGATKIKIKARAQRGSKEVAHAIGEEVLKMLSEADSSGEPYGKSGFEEGGFAEGTQAVAIASAFAKLAAGVAPTTRAWCPTMLVYRPAYSTRSSEFTFYDLRKFV